MQVKIEPTLDPRFHVVVVLETDNTGRIVHHGTLEECQDAQDRFEYFLGAILTLKGLTSPTLESDCKWILEATFQDSV